MNTKTNVPDIAHARERLAEARAALADTPVPTPGMGNHLYYPLLFLCETVAPVLDQVADYVDRKGVNAAWVPNGTVQHPHGRLMADGMREHDPARSCANDIHGCTQLVTEDNVVVGASYAGVDKRFCSESCLLEFELLERR